MEISVADFLAPIGASVFKFCVHLQVDKVYCVNENKYAKSNFACLLFQFFLLSLLYNTYGHIFVIVSSATTWFRIMIFCVHLRVGTVYCVNENLDANANFASFYQILFFSSVTPI